MINSTSRYTSSFPWHVKIPMKQKGKCMNKMAKDREELSINLLRENGRFYARDVNVVSNVTPVSRRL